MFRYFCQRLPSYDFPSPTNAIFQGGSSNQSPPCYTSLEPQGNQLCYSDGFDNKIYLSKSTEAFPARYNKRMLKVKSQKKVYIYTYMI